MYSGIIRDLIQKISPQKLFLITWITPNQTLEFFLNFSKAFDVVDNSFLLDKLPKNGICGKFLKFH